jgi:RNA polymerase sigma-70 factor, ECF subfamily
VTLAYEFHGTSASALAWVRMLLVGPAAASGMTARDNQERKLVATPEKAILADVKAAAGGDGAAYARIVDRYQNLLAQRMMRFSRDPAVIEELVHDVFVEAYFSLGSYRGDAPLEHWLQRIATRVGYRNWKQKRKEPTVSLQHAQHDPPARAGAGAEQDAADEVAVVLEQLPPRDRLVLTLLYLESRSVAEAADLAGWSQTMVKVQAHRARQKFRKLLDKSQTSATSTRT